MGVACCSALPASQPEVGQQPLTTRPVDTGIDPDTIRPAKPTLATPCCPGVPSREDQICRAWPMCCGAPHAHPGSLHTPRCGTKPQPPLLLLMVSRAGPAPTPHTPPWGDALPHPPAHTHPGPAGARPPRAASLPPSAWASVWLPGGHLGAVSPPCLPPSHLGPRLHHGDILIRVHHALDVLGAAQRPLNGCAHLGNGRHDLCGSRGQGGGWGGAGATAAAGGGEGG